MAGDIHHLFEGETAILFKKGIVYGRIERAAV
jgi:hypothetical protein